MMMNSVHNKKFRIISKTRFYLFIITALVLLFIAFYTFRVDAVKLSEIKTESVYVVRGDTLWSLSKKYVCSGMDIREYIEEVVNYNKLQSVNIKPGQLIYMPVYSGK